MISPSAAACAELCAIAMMQGIAEYSALAPGAAVGEAFVVPVPAREVS